MNIGQSVYAYPHTSNRNPISQLIPRKHIRNLQVQSIINIQVSKRDENITPWITTHRGENTVHIYKLTSSVNLSLYSKIQMYKYVNQERLYEKEILHERNEKNE